MSRTHIPEDLRQLVLDRANGKCEYCFLNQANAIYPHEVDHIISEKHGGKTERLLDSIYKEYPIGSFFFWEAPAKYNLFYRDMPELGIVPSRPRSTEILNFILDGQQRTCSLYAAVHGRVVVEFDLPSGKKTIDCSRICLDLDYAKKLPDAGNNIRVFEVQDEDDRFIPLYKEGYLDYCVKTALPFAIRQAVGGLVLKEQLAAAGIELSEKTINFLTAALSPDIGTRPDSFQELI